MHIIPASATVKVGTSAKGRNWRMLIIAGVYVGDDGSSGRAVDFALFERDDAPLPTIVVGATYIPTFSVEVKDGKFVTRVASFTLKK